MSARMVEPVLTVRDLHKTFPGAHVLKGVDLEVRAGEVHAFVGANGSGKSTTIKVLAGYHHGDPGSRATLAGAPLDLSGTASSRHGDLRFVHQDLGLVEEMNAVDNIALTHGFRCRRGGRIDWREQERVAAQVMRRFGTSIDLRAPLSEASAVARTEVAIAAAMFGWEARQGVLVLDEPTAMLPPTQVERLFDIVRQVRSSGASVLYVSHRLDEVFELADRVSVIRAGRIVATVDVADITPAGLTDLMVGESGSAERRTERAATTDEVVLEVRDLHARSARGVSFDLCRGEVLGIAGLIGSGSEEIPYAVAGMCPDVTGGSLRQSADDGGRVPIVPAHRLAEGVFAAGSVRSNLTISVLDRLTRAGRISSRQESALVADWVDRLDIDVHDIDAPVSMLSGGNQQKVVIARCLAQTPSILAMCEPTAGVDIATRIRIYDLVSQQAAEGLSVVVTSSDLGDLIAMCHRVLVLRDGVVVSELSGEQITESSIVHAMEGTRAA